VIEYLSLKKVLILGFGAEGKSTYNFIRGKMSDFPLTVADRIEQNIDDKNTKVIWGDEYLSCIKDYDVVFKSPGISIKDLKVPNGTEVTCQTDMFLKYAPCKKIGVTGTKGKTTTSTLIYLMLKNAGFKTCLIGNIGVPVFEMLECESDLLAVIEMSSHQLEFVKTSPNAAVITNIYPEHLDHYNGFDDYVNAKLNIIRYQQKGDFLVSNAEQEIEQFIDFDIRARHARVSSQSNDPFLERLNGLNANLKGRHNVQDIFFAAEVAKHFGANQKAIEKGVMEFSGIPHRMESVGTYKGIHFYNDCIATIPESVMLAADALCEVDTIIIGGMDRNIDYTEFISYLLNSGIKNIICMPQTGYEIGKKLKEQTSDKNIIFSQDMEAAVKESYKNTAAGKICLLSPAASSYNVYKNFEEKGGHFKSLIKEFAQKDPK
jgi:UDP-N-acetylmuramoylalanine--D-glutamate ligase